MIVVAADDGVMPQTIEAVSARESCGRADHCLRSIKWIKLGPIPDRVKQQLTEQQLVPEEWGGDTIYVPVSAHTQAWPCRSCSSKFTLVAEVGELKANPGALGDRCRDREPHG